MNKTPKNKSLNKSNTLFKYFSKSPATSTSSVNKTPKNDESETKSEEVNVKTDGKTSNLTIFRNF